MKRILQYFALIFSALFISVVSHAQSVGINGTGAAPNASAMLDVSSTTSGILVPRMTQAQRDAISSPATGLLIYETDNTTGFYYFDGTIWRWMGNNSNIGWLLTGNSGTVPGTNFIGTTDATDFVFKTNGSENMRLANATGNLVLGSGDGSSSVSGNTLRAPNAAGLNITGTNITLMPGNGTGTGGSGNLIFESAPAITAGAAVDTMLERMRINPSGNIIIGSGENTNTVIGNVLRAPNALGINIYGANLTVAPGNGTGTGGSGSLIFETASPGLTGGTANTVTERMRLTSTGALSFNGASNYGTSGQVLTSNGNSAPTWASLNSSLATSSVMTSTTGVSIVNGSGQVVGGSNLTINVATNSSASPGLVTAGSGNNNKVWGTDGSGNPSWATANAALTTNNIAPAAGSAVKVTNGTGQVIGGSNVSLDVQGTNGGVFYGTGAGTSATFTAAGSLAQIMTVNASGIPVWTTATYPTTTTANQLLYSSATNTVTGLAAGTNGQVLTMSGGVPTWAAASASLANLTPGTGLTGSVYNGSTAQTFAVAYGSTAGTAVQGNTTLTITPGTGMSGGGTITLGAGGTITLNNTGLLTANNGLSISGGNNVQFGGTLIQTTTITHANFDLIHNLSGTGNFRVQNSGSDALEVMSGTGNVVIGWGEATITPTGNTLRAPNASGTNIAGANFTLTPGIGTGTGGSGYVSIQTAAAGASGTTSNTLTEALRVTNTGNVVVGSLELTGVPTGNILRAPSGAGTNITGANMTITPGNGTGSGGSGNLIFQTAPIAATGTTANTMTERMRLTATGALAFSGAANYGTSGSMLQSTGNSTPAWSTATYPTTTTANQLLYSSATNTVTGLAAGTNGQVLTMSGGVPTWASASASLANLAPGTGLTGTAYNGSAAQTFAVNYGSTAGSAVQGNTTLTITPGTGMSGGGTITLGSGGTVTLNNTGVTSVGLALPSIFTVTNSPVTTTGTLTGSFTTETANTVFAGPSSGGAATPTFRALVAADIPAGVVTANNGLSISGGNNVQLGGTLIQTTTITQGNFDLISNMSGTGNFRVQNSGSDAFSVRNGTGNVVIGSGEATGVVAGNTLRGPNATGTNIAGANMTITPGDGTGTGGSGNLIFQTAPTAATGTTANTMTERMRLTTTGALAFSGAANYGTSGSMLQSTGNSTPAWSTATYPTTTTANQLLYSSAANTVTGLATGTNGQILTMVGGVPTWGAATGNYWSLTGNGGTVPGTNFLGTTDANDLVFETNSSENMRIANSSGNVVIGNGEGGSAVGNTIRAPYNNSGGNRTGADLTIASGAPTGKGASGSIIFQTLAANVGSPGNTSDLSIMAEVMRITSTGALAFNGAANYGTSGSMLQSTGNNNPAWSTATYPTTTTANQLLYSSATNTVTGLAAGTNGQVLTMSGGVPTWASASASLANLTPGTGLTGSAYNGSTAQTFAVSYGSAAGTAVQGNTTLTISPGTGMSGGGTITLGTGGTVTLNNTGVTSVGLALPSIFTVTNSPVTTTGTLTGSFTTETANTVFAGPSSGGAATPTFRALVAADIPAGVVTANNGLSISGGNNVQLGGTLIQTTTITQGNYDLISNMSGTGNFRVQKSAADALEVMSATGNVVIGSGDATATVAGNTLRAPNGAGTNITGANFTLASGNGSGTGGSGYVSIQTAPAGVSGTTGNTLTEAMRIANTGNIIIGNGEGTATVNGNTLRTPNAAGTNIPGSNFTITPGNGTGTGGSGNLIFQTASTGATGTTANTMTERMRLTLTGALAFSGAANYGVSGSMLQSTGNSTPAWSTATYPTTTTANQILYSSATNTVTGLAAGTNGQILIMSGGVPTWGAVTNNNWTLTGNSGTTAGTNFIGTIDATDFEIKTGVGPTERMHFVNSTGNVVIGSGEGTAVVAGNTLRGPNGVGTNIAGSNLTITSGDGTGTGGSGNVIFQSAPVAATGTTANTMTERMRLTPTGALAFSGAANYGTSGSMLQSTGNSTPAWSTATYPTTTTADQILYSSATNTVTGLAAGTNGQVLIMSGGVPTWGAATSNNWTLTGNSGTTAGTNFIGTTDATDFEVKTGVGPTERMHFVNSTGNVVIGSGEGTATVVGNTLRGPNGVGTNISGVDFTIAGGNGTGTGGGGDVVFQTSPTGASGTTANTLTERVRINYAGNVIIGSGDGTGTVVGNILRGPNPIGTNIAGVDFTIAGGGGTGNGGGGDVVFQTEPAAASGATANTLTERMRIMYTGNVGIGTAAPTTLLQVNGTESLGTPSSTTGTLQFDNSSNANTVSVSAGATSTSYSLTLPTAAPTSSGQVLSSTTAGVMSWSSPSGQLLGIICDTTAGATVATLAAGTTMIVVKVVGGGGAGGGIGLSGTVYEDQTGSGGGGGAYCEGYLNGITVGTSTVTMTVGAGGAGAAGNNGTVAANGVNSTVVVTSPAATFTAGGGKGGTTSEENTGGASINTAGGSGGTSSGGSINIPGANGGSAIISITGNDVVFAGEGASSIFGNGGQQQYTRDDVAYAGLNARSPGAGGGGAVAVQQSSNSNTKGGSGEHGIIIIYEY